jgi:N-acetylmuramoyl-L-alanine amidase
MRHLRTCIYLLFTLTLTLALVTAADAASKKKNSKKTTRPAVVKQEPAPTLPPAQVLDIKHWSTPDYTRVAVSLDRDATWKSYELDKGSAGKPGRIVIDIQNSQLGAAIRDITIGDGLLKGVRVALFRAGVVRVVLDTDQIRDYKIFPLSDPSKLIIDVRGERPTELSSLENSLTNLVNEATAAELPKPADHQEFAKPRSAHKQHPAIAKVRRIVVDPGHGGHDPGAVGQSGLQEKEVVLSIGLKLREKLQHELGLDVVMTRSTDVFIPLEERTAIANKVGADLFVSIHANAAPNRNANGIETYYLNLAKTEKVAQLAAKENGTSLEKVSTLQAILFDLMANYKLNDSAHLAEEVQKALYKTIKGKHSDTKSLGVKQGPFYVLVGATMPSILVETAFISNSAEEAHLQDPAFHDLAADGILDGIRGYISSLK